MRKYLIITFLLSPLLAAAQEVVQVGRGSYASYAPLIKSRTDEHGGDQTQFMAHRKLYLREREGQPIPTNDWWTNLITEQYSGHLWSYPQYVQARDYGLDVQFPTYWIDNGTEMKSNSLLKISAPDFRPESAIAEQWHDWDVSFSLSQGWKRMNVTMAHGMPFTWVETRGIAPTITPGLIPGGPTSLTPDPFPEGRGEWDSPAYYVLSGDKVLPYEGQKVTGVLAVRIAGDVYGIFLPEGAEVNIDAKGVCSVTYAPSSEAEYIVIGALPSLESLPSFAPYAYSVPRSTEVSWSYQPNEGKVKTIWTVTAAELGNAPSVVSTPASPLGGNGRGAVLQGFLPHHYRDTGFPCALPFTGDEYATPHGRLKLAAGSQFEVDYKFSGMLPYYALPLDTAAVHGFDREKMLTMLRAYAAGGTFGDDTYWGGKGLTQMALYMTFAREMGETELFRQCRDRLKANFVDWLTYTPGETQRFFARTDRWGGLVGYDTSYDSETFNDHHFHYGYFTLAGALLALVDDGFREQYGPMLRLVAKDYANWERTDTQYPFFRTFDPWAGHSFAGGMGDGNGNGQESSSEAMQSWGGLYLLGVALGDDAMRDAGLFGWVSEARGTAEYWFDRHRDNIDYTKFEHPYNANLTCHGVGWWTYFSGDPVWMSSIQWMPISPALDYLSEDLDFAAWDFRTMWEGKEIGGWYAQDKNAKGEYLGGESGLGNVVLSYLQRSDPQQAAEIFDNLWAAGAPLAKNTDTGGITYYATHSHLTYGELAWDVWASVPTARAYKAPSLLPPKGEASESLSFQAFNPTSSPIDVDFFRNGEKIYKLENVPARSLKVSGVESCAVEEIAQADTTEADPRETLEMVNLALGRPCTESGHENVGTVPEHATDGDDTSRWGSLHRDGEWLTVDLGEPTAIYKVRIHWEAAYASQYKLLLSNDGEHFEEAADVSCSGGWVETMMGDRTARFVKVLGVRRATDYGISLYELQVFGRKLSMADADLLGVRISSERAVLKQGEASRVFIEGYTCGGAWTDVSPEWSSEDGDITADGLFTPAVYGTATVTARVGSLSVSKALPVEEALRLRALALSPRKAQLIVGQPSRFKLTGVDQFGNATAPTEPSFATDATETFHFEALNADDASASFGSANGNTTFPFSLTIATPGDYLLIARLAPEGARLLLENLTTQEPQNPTEVLAPADTILLSARNFEDINLALGKPATATSQEWDGNGAAYATDGDEGTRWSSQWAGLDATTKNAQVITVDLEAVYEVNRVRFLWENAYAKEYYVEVSVDGSDWQAVRHVTNSPGGRETVEFSPVEARYVRMRGVRPSMEAYGYSLYEFEVYGLRLVYDGLLLPAAPDASASFPRLYDLTGRRLSVPPTHGVYLQEGRKRLR